MSFKKKLDKAIVKKKKPKIKVFYLDLHTRYKTIFRNKQVMELKDIQYYVGQFLYHCNNQPNTKFKVFVKDLMGYSPSVVVDLFAGKSRNVKVIMKLNKESTNGNQ